MEGRTGGLIELAVESGVIHGEPTCVMTDNYATSRTGTRTAMRAFIYQVALFCDFDSGFFPRV